MTAITALPANLPSHVSHARYDRFFSKSYRFVDMGFPLFLRLSSKTADTRHVSQMILVEMKPVDAEPDKRDERYYLTNEKDFKHWEQQARANIISNRRLVDRPQRFYL